MLNYMLNSVIIDSSTMRFVNVSNREDSRSTLVIVPENRTSEKDALSFASSLSDIGRVLVLLDWNLVDDGEFKSVNSLLAALSDSKVRHASFFGIGNGASLVQAFAARAGKIVRRVVLLNSTTRSRPKGVTNLIDSVERYLPLGLPLAQVSKGFDSRPFLHRVRCPSLILISPEASSYCRKEGHSLLNKIPSARLSILKQSAVGGDGGCSMELKQVVGDFLKVSVKKSQKSIK